MTRPAEDPVEVAWSHLSPDPAHGLTVLVRATDDPQAVVVEVWQDQRADARWEMPRAVLRSLVGQLRFWVEEFGEGPDRA